MKSMEKYEKLLEHMKQYEKLCIAYSGGMDSSLLLKAAKDALGDNVIAVFADTVFFKRNELEFAKKTAEDIGVGLNVTNIDVLYVPQIAFNESNRCYHCKMTILTDIIKVALLNGIKTVAEGRCADDTDRYRPGYSAAEELGIVFPLKDCGIYKEDIREICRELELPVWNRPSNSCLATRFPFETEMAEDKLETVEKAEDFIAGFGVGLLRFRVHDDFVRIEAGTKDDFHKIVENSKEIVEFSQSLGYKHITLDLQGYKVCSMDE